jgi:hypothetical protein
MLALIILLVVFVICLALMIFATSPKIARAAAALAIICVLLAAVICITATVQQASAQQPKQESQFRLIATLCKLNLPADCIDHLVTTSISMPECMIAVRDLPQWSEQFPAYYVAGWKCQLGTRVQEREARNSARRMSTAYQWSPACKAG